MSEYVCVQRCCVLHYPIILSGAAAAQAGILTTASGPTCTATDGSAARAISATVTAVRPSSGRRRCTSANSFRKDQQNNYIVYKLFYFDKQLSNRIPRNVLIK